MPEIFLKTIDGVSVFADWSPHADSTKAALFLHQRSKDHTMWAKFRKTLEAKGWSTLAIDLRGHGRSSGFPKGTQINADGDAARIDADIHGLKFDQVDDYHTMYFDVTAACDFIKRQLVPELVEGHADSSQGKPFDSAPLRSGNNYKLAVIGSSIGANLALAYAADHFEVKAVVLLSPGLNYYGLRTDDVMIEYHRPLALLTAKDDPSHADAQKLIKLPGVARPNLWYQEFDTGGHGTALFEAHPEFMEKIAEWMEKIT